MMESQCTSMHRLSTFSICSTNRFENNLRLSLTESNLILLPHARSTSARSNASTLGVDPPEHRMPILYQVTGMPSLLEHLSTVLRSLPLSQSSPSLLRVSVYHARFHPDTGVFVEHLNHLVST